jgi:hypothetical protein
MRLGENVPIPELMKGNKLDKRGYPIPYIVFRDSKNRPQFTVNDSRFVKRCLFHNRCGICGNKLGEVVYFVGGPGSAFHPNGAYVDPPMHKECATYALQVCPFLAYRPYAGAKATYVVESTEDPRIVVEDPTMLKGKPEVFVLKGTLGFVNMQDWQRPRLVPTSDEGVEFWKDGVQLDVVDHADFLEGAIERALGVIDGLDDTPNSYGNSKALTSVHALSTLSTQRR